MSEVDLTADIRLVHEIIGKCTVTENPDGSITVTAVVKDPLIVEMLTSEIRDCLSVGNVLPKTIDTEHNKIAVMRNELDDHIRRSPQWSRYGYQNDY